MLRTTEAPFITELDARDLLHLRRMNRAYRACFGDYLPRIEPEPDQEAWWERLLLWMLPPSCRAEFPPKLARILNAGPLDAARLRPVSGDAAVLQAWGLQLIRQLINLSKGTEDQAVIQCVMIKALLKLPDYRIELSGSAPKRTSMLPAGLRMMYTSDDPAIRTLVCDIERVFCRTAGPIVKNNEWKALLRANSIYWRNAFPLEETEYGKRVKIDACCTQWLAHPDRIIRLQNVCALAALIRRAPHQEVAAISFAEFLMRHPVREQTDLFVEVLAYAIATFAQYYASFYVSTQEQSSAFQRTLLNALPDQTPALEGALWQKAFDLSQQVINEQNLQLFSVRPNIRFDAPVYDVASLFHALV